MMGERENKRGQRERRGSVLVFTLILMAVVLLSAIGIMSTTIINQNIASVTDDSVIAFQTADTGAEQAFHEFRKDRIARLNDFTGGSCSGGTITVSNVNGVAQAHYEIQFFKENGSRMTSCTEDTKTVRAARATGYYLKAVRAVEFAVSIPTDDITNGLIAHWPFDSDLRDAVSNHDGTRRGNARTTSSSKAVGSGALTLDGSGDYVRIPSSSDFNFSQNDDYTIALWAKFDSVSGGHTVLHKRLGFSLESDGTNLKYQGLSGSPFRLRANRWYHIVLWQSGATGSRGLYVDGERIADAHAANASRTKSLFFGTYNVGGGYARYLDGLIDDVRIYDRALDVAEIAILCENTFDGNGGHPEGSDCGQQ